MKVELERRATGSTSRFQVPKRSLRGEHPSNHLQQLIFPHVCLCCSGGPLILEIPALPVRTGSDVTLRCRRRNGGAVAAYFFFNGSSVQDEPKELLLSKVQQSGEGLYRCSTDEFGSSPQSLLRVRGQVSSTLLISHVSKKSRAKS